MTRAPKGDGDIYWAKEGGAARRYRHLQTQLDSKERDSILKSLLRRTVILPIHLQRTRVVFHGDLPAAIHAGLDLTDNNVQESLFPNLTASVPVSRTVDTF